MQKIITNSEQETFDFAKNFAKSLRGGEVIGLSGDLGAGKTIFSKGIAAGLGVKDNVNSPTFVIMKKYEIKNQKSEIRNLIHIDAYRLNSAEDIRAIGADEYFEKPETITVIEWPENIKKILPKNTIYFHIKNITADKREIKRA
ncbi:MAG: hypothetical protein US83_C0010G0101 [Candidatus Falkowbacteria bacterium GW2011_GWC2_38_22]|uniref:tRNA threonylcarbamoyladenosine biosynthesis protein TsaE n=1 Tax=Candidatus Falkowbacteria bacterium GW2011_GWE1_38_31 TaxID=1618638 RepID=A0A0G0K417_9BACT|nr:MAG: hypothetical protein US73_C0005G0101 [Candidatus Falkowbacteria bacterium GW2011_GWF2_38_1205]KKQ61065.1 MAG: hypothetical protein US83_C0010G0101 [Candidatus Falkowbacteria bacterium GW2011_GWC2_38_22]KKQ63406.1 MAG: hypothetical protein US84_C0006G0007 [Candidatus Falkowbacteria bacterium GW2011_GWF1_38_22]KKQ65523.1 MAG: hypothetical protein US87_C0007G0101 [Candidatus Falkowbacteria bacterium GW2011_GWE2_38_254]KKQ70170.1 MAG: hypothetical protein US91_C0006G0007 [Candidatus Falkowb